MEKYVVEYRRRWRSWSESRESWQYGEWQQKSAISLCHPGSFAEAKAWIERQEPECEIEITTFYPKGGNPY